MSRGPGKIQQTILALVENDVDGAWTTTDICRCAYRGVNRVEKKHRVAVSRALREINLPEQWTVRRSDARGSEHILYSRLSVESTILMMWHSFGRHCSIEQFRLGYRERVDDARRGVEEYRRYYEADALERIDLQIADARKRAALARSMGVNEKYFENVALEISALVECKAALERELNVSGPTPFPRGNTYLGQSYDQ